MSGFHHVTARHSPPYVRKSAAVTRAARSVPSTKAGISQKVPIKGTKARTQTKEEEEEIFDFEDEGDMATSFLQYCAMCEKQILVPNNSILYCSEHCRRLDAMPSSTSSILASISSPSHKFHELQPRILDPLGLSLPRYIPALQPTPRHHKDARIPPKAHNGKSDLDPTEWKPSDPANSYDDDHDTSTASLHSNNVAHNKPKPLSRDNSEALLYLSKFHRSPESPISKHRRATPSLSRTSTATASSSSSETSLAGTPYSFVSNPPVVSIPTTSITTPISSTDKALRGLSLKEKAGVNGMDYGKKTVMPDSKSARGSLKKLLATGPTGEM